VRAAAPWGSYTLGAIATFDSIRRTGPLLQRIGVLPRRSTERQQFEGEDLERFLQSGADDLSKLAADFLTYTGGATLAGRTALDYGCGPGRLALPLAAKCEQVYGLDITDEMLGSAQRNARLRGVENVQWLRAERLAELHGRYDLVVSMWVFQHIPTHQGERIFEMLVQGLRPGGIGAINLTLRQSHPWRGLARGIAALDRMYIYQLMHSYSLNRLGELLVDAGINDWYARWHARRGGDLLAADARRRHPAITIVFRKP
jgi:2-polyprenyl-3-methyl-5-hydroxy-6-metoxy-1,4-benzoquinol methylase